jgi:hypothetical protein
MSNDISSTHSGGAVGTVGRFDVRAAMRQLLAPFKAADPWRDLSDICERCSYATQRDATDDHGLIALHPWRTAEEKGWAIRDALTIRVAVGPHLEAINDVLHDDLEEAMKPAPEEIIRAILGAMLSILRIKPTEGAEVYIDAMVWALMEPEPFYAPAIAAAAKEIWTTKTFPHFGQPSPSVAEFMKPTKEHQQRLDGVWHDLNFITASYYAAWEVLQALAPEKLPPPRKWSAEMEAWMNENF